MYYFMNDRFEFSEDGKVRNGSGKEKEREELMKE